MCELLKDRLAEGLPKGGALLISREGKPIQAKQMVAALRRVTGNGGLTEHSMGELERSTTPVWAWNCQ